MITQARAAHASIVLDGKDYFSVLAPYFVSLTYEDNCDGKKADDLQITLADRDKRFISDWMPSKGAFLDAGIIAERWFMPFAPGLKLDCGRFWIDSIEFELPAHTVIVKANSIPTNVRLKQSIETRGWEETTLQDISNQIAGENKMTLDWQSDHNPRYGRTEQHDESALSFLMKRADDAKLAIKVNRNKIIIFDEQKLEDQAPKFTLLYGNAAGGGGGATYRMAGGTFTTTIMDKTKKAKVKHVNVETGETEQGEAEDSQSDEEGGDNDEDVDQNVNVDTDAADTGGVSLALRAEAGSAEQWNAADTMKAKSIVRDKNKHKYLGKVEMSIGNPLVAAGMTMTLSGVGQYDGKWFIEQAHHELGPEYKTELTIRRCLQGL
jgi:Phage protein D